jgi:phosphate starvation-inducible PhoH-like protein
MREASIAFENPEHLRELCGTHDRFLNRIRDSVGVRVVQRGDELRLIGSDDQIRRGMDVFLELKTLLERRGFVGELDVISVIDGNGPVSSSGSRPRTPGDESAGATSPDRTKKVSPRTPGQAAYLDAMRQHDLVLCAGPAGCGKTYLAVAMAVECLRNDQISKIVLARPAIEAGERLGFLPGDLNQKVNPYMRPLEDALHDLVGYDQVKRLKERDVIEVIPLAFMRGRTLNRTFMILDEGQNTTISQMKMFLTRMGEGSRIVVTGDLTQNDLAPNVPSGLNDAIDRVGRIAGVATVRLTGADIVRHRLVREIVAAYDTGEKFKGEATVVRGQDVDLAAGVHPSANGQ